MGAHWESSFQNRPADRPHSTAHLVRQNLPICDAELKCSIWIIAHNWPAISERFLSIASDRFSLCASWKRAIKHFFWLDFASLCECQQKASARASARRESESRQKATNGGLPCARRAPGERLMLAPFRLLSAHRPKKRCVANGTQSEDTSV